MMLHCLHHWCAQQIMASVLWSTNRTCDLHAILPLLNLISLSLPPFSQLDELAIASLTSVLPPQKFRYDNHMENHSTVKHSVRWIYVSDDLLLWHRPYHVLSSWSPCDRELPMDPATSIPFRGIWDQRLSGAYQSVWQWPLVHSFAKPAPGSRCPKKTASGSGSRRCSAAPVGEGLGVKTTACRRKGGTHSVLVLRPRGTRHPAHGDWGRVRPLQRERPGWARRASSCWPPRSDLTSPCRLMDLTGVLGPSKAPWALKT